jgi:fluoride exporter
MTFALVMAGAAVGAPTRWLLDRFVQRLHDSVFPWGTFTINVLGSLLLGLVLGTGASADLVLLLGTGFCGGFTTFSTFGYETVRLMEDGSGTQAVLNVAASLAAGLAAATAGWYLGVALAG